MLKWWQDIRRFDKALSRILGLFACLIFFLAGLSILVRSDEASNMIFGGFLVVFAGSFGFYFWRLLRGLKGDGQHLMKTICPSCQLEFRIDEEQLEDPLNCPRCGRVIDD